MPVTITCTKVKTGTSTVHAEATADDNHLTWTLIDPPNADRSPTSDGTTANGYYAEWTNVTTPTACTVKVQLGTMNDQKAIPFNAGAC